LAHLAEAEVGAEEVDCIEFEEEPEVHRKNQLVELVEIHSHPQPQVLGQVVLEVYHSCQELELLQQLDHVQHDGHDHGHVHDHDLRHLFLQQIFAG